MKRLELPMPILPLILLQLVAPPVAVVSPPVAPPVIPESNGERYRIPERYRAPVIYTAPQKIMTIDVDATALGQTLWQGTFRVGGANGANFTRSLTQAPPEGCANADEDRRPGSREGLRINLNAYRAAETNRITFEINWDRPTESCALGELQRAVSVSGKIDLQPNKPITVEGDGGLRVRFTLR